MIGPGKNECWHNHHAGVIQGDLASDPGTNAADLDASALPGAKSLGSGVTPGVIPGVIPGRTKSTIGAMSSPIEVRDTSGQSVAGPAPHDRRAGTLRRPHGEEGGPGFKGLTSPPALALGTATRDSAQNYSTTAVNPLQAEIRQQRRAQGLAAQPTAETMRRLAAIIVASRTNTDGAGS